MAIIKIDDCRSIGEGQACFLIAEIGQNHQGDVDIAKQMVREAAHCGVDCVKFQKTDIAEKFNRGALSREYKSANSWGATYGEHKQHLEFSDDDFRELKEYSDRMGVYFSASAMDANSLDFLSQLNLPFVKIGSGDSNNIPLLKKASSKGVPLIVSTGMADGCGVKKIYEIIKKRHLHFCLLHCVSSYPAPFDEVNLKVIQEYQRSFPDIPIGYSSHDVGAVVPIAAVAMGAKDPEDFSRFRVNCDVVAVTDRKREYCQKLVIEKHFTLDKSLKGTDHASSLEPKELSEMVRQIRTVERALGSGKKVVVPSEGPCMEKLLKSIVTATALRKGAVLKEEDLKIKVAHPKGIDAGRFEDIVGRRLVVDKLTDEPLFFNDILFNL